MVRVPLPIKELKMSRFPLGERNPPRDIGLKKLDYYAPAEVTRRDSIPLENLVPANTGKFDFQRDGWRIRDQIILKTNVGRETALSRFLTCFQDPGKKYEPNVYAICKDEWEKKRQSLKMTKLSVSVEYREGMRPEGESQVLASITATYYGSEIYGHEGRLVINGGWDKLAEHLGPMVLKEGASLDPAVAKIEQDAHDFNKGKEKVYGWEMHPDTWKKIMDAYATLPHLAGGRVFLDDSDLVLVRSNPTLLHNNRMKAIQEKLETSNASPSAWDSVYEVEQENGKVFITFDGETAHILSVSREFTKPERKPLDLKVNQKLFALGLPLTLNKRVSKDTIKPVYTKPSQRRENKDLIVMGNIEDIDIKGLKKKLDEQARVRAERVKYEVQYIQGEGPEAEVRITGRNPDRDER